MQVGQTVIAKTDISEVCVHLSGRGVGDIVEKVVEQLKSDGYYVRLGGYRPF